jgi:hypothetical protein
MQAYKWYELVFPLSEFDSTTLQMVRKFTVVVHSAVTNETNVSAYWMDDLRATQYQ